MGKFRFHTLQNLQHVNITIYKSHHILINITLLRLVSTNLHTKNHTLTITTQLYSYHYISIPPNDILLVLLTFNY